jgi:hypothetical protein
VRYTVVGDAPIVTKRGLVQPGDTLSDVDLDEGTVLAALVSGGHLEKAAPHPRKKVAE